MGIILRNCRSSLYRKLPRSVTLAFLTAMAVVVAAQIAKRPPADQGPRALAVLQLADNGRARLIPVTIMLNGKFYDAGAYKADPVPMALQRDTVYEALKSGVSQGLFTVSGAAQNQGAWFADGKWRSKAQIDADKAKLKADAEKRAQKAPPEQDISGPPKLRRGPATGTQAPTTQAPATQAPATTTTGAPKSGDSAATQKSSSSGASSQDDPNRPIMRRQPVSETTHEQTKAETEPLKGPLQMIAAISDAEGPEARPYTYNMKPEEEQVFLKKMLALAADAVRARAQQISAKSAEPKLNATRKPAGTKAGSSIHSTPPAEFRNVEMHVLDLSNSNEPVLVLTAETAIPSSGSDIHYTVALVARQDIYGELHKMFAQASDSQHLDVLPKYDFIDAVDADGDGRGELLFRMTSESGSAFAVYRVIGDRLWPLFEGKPGA